MSNHCTTKDEICNLLKELKKNETKTTTDISNIYKNLDDIINSNSKIRKRLRKSVTDITEYTGGGNNEIELDEDFVKWIKSIQKRYKKDKTWLEDFINEMKYEKIKNFKILKKNINDDNELLPYLIKEFKVDFEELLNYPKQQIDRNYLIKAIEKINSKFNLVEKEDIYSISIEQLYKHLSSLITKYKDKIPEKDIKKILRNFGKEDHLDYQMKICHQIIKKKLKDYLNFYIYVQNNELNNKKNILENLKERVYSKNIKNFIEQISNNIKQIYHTKSEEIQENLNNSGIGKKFFKILTNDGKIEVNDIDYKYYDILEIVIRDNYEQYLIHNNSISEIHNNTLPIGFIVENIKNGPDSQFASIVSCLDDDDLMEIISNKCIKNKNPSIKNFCKNLSKVRINAKNNYISNSKVNIAQQIIRELVSNFVKDYMNYNPYVIHTLSIVMEYKDSSQYNHLSLPFIKQKYHPFSEKNMGLSDIEVKKITNELKSLITQSEYLNPDYLDNLTPVYWGDEITWNILGFIFYKYFGILLIYISGTSKQIRIGKYISWFSHIQLHKNTNLKDKAKYAIFMSGSPSTNDKGIHYNSMYYVNKKKKIKLFSIDKKSSEFKKYPDLLKDFIENITYYS